MLAANNPNLTSWLSVDKDSDFPIQNIPFGIFKTDKKTARAGTIIGNTVIDIAELAERNYFAGAGISHDNPVFLQANLNEFIALGQNTWRSVRQTISDLFRAETPAIRDVAAIQAKVLHKVEEVELLMPVRVGDYTDFYSSRDHATNIGCLFRDPENALLPNWLHLPVGYHGRSSSIVVSGTNIHRPKGQTMPNGADKPVYGPSRLFDFELEMAFITGQGKDLGQSISTAEADDHIFGMVLFNDLSARDIQKWEYVPLGPFLGKSFGSVVSPWIVTLDALLPFRIPGPVQEPEVLPYLRYEGEKHIDIKLKAQLGIAGHEPVTLSDSNFKHMYWTMQQQLAHHTVNGCNVNAGDMMASGTISGPTPDSYGSMLEISWRGTKPVPMPDGSERKFFKDGDEIILTGYCEKDSVRIGFGECKTKVLPAL